MTTELDERAKLIRSLHWLSFANIAIWAIAIIAMVFLMQDSSVVKKLFPILAGGVAVGVSMISIIPKLK